MISKLNTFVVSSFNVAVTVAVSLPYSPLGIIDSSPKEIRVEFEVHVKSSLLVAIEAPLEYCLIIGGYSTEDSNVVNDKFKLLSSSAIPLNKGSFSSINVP